MLNTVRGALVAVTAASALATGAHATEATLDFNQLDAAHAERPGGFYNGGLGSRGSGPGPNLGITFDAFSSTDPDPAFVENLGAGNVLLVFGDGDGASGVDVHVAGGFSGSVDFDVGTSSGVILKILGQPAGGFDTVITSRVDQPQTDCTPLTDFCPFRHFVMPFTGEAFSFRVSTSFRGNTTLDNIHFSNLNLPSTGGGGAGGGGGAVPEPASWALMISGFGLAGAALRRNRRRLAAA